MQHRPKSETAKTFRRQVRFPKELVEAIDAKAGEGNFSRWVVLKLWEAIDKEQGCK